MSHPASMESTESALDQEMNLSERAARRQTQLEQTILAAGLPPLHALSPEERATAPDPELFRKAATKRWRREVKEWLDEVRRNRSGRQCASGFRGVPGVPDDRPPDLWLRGLRMA